MSKSNVGSMLCFLSFVFWIGETWYFGWNLSPASPAERMCDHIVLMMVGLGLLLCAIGWADRVDRRLRRLEER